MLILIAVVGCFYMLYFLQAKISAQKAGNAAGVAWGLGQAGL